MAWKHILAMGTPLFGVAATIAAPAEATCAVSADAGESVVIVGHAPGAALRLADGRAVRLAGLDPLSLRLPDLGRVEATLVSTGSLDRHGAVRSDLFVDAGSLSEMLLAQGRARVRPAAGDPACYARLYAAEGHARRRSLGLWGEQGYAVADASDPKGVAPLADRFAVVTGRIHHVGTAGRSIYLDFGPSWKTDVTLTIRTKDRSRFTAAGLVPESLEGEMIRARGIVTLRGGPSIEITEPAAIERVAGD